MNKGKQTTIERINVLLRETDDAYHDIALHFGISDSVMHILYAICSSGHSCQLSDITSTGISKQTVNSALRKLEAEGIVYLERTGGRKKAVCLTEKGELLADQTVRRVIVMENEIMDGWSEEDRLKYIELNQRYLTDLREKMKEL